MSLPTAKEQKELLPLLEELARSIEDLLLTGLAAASDKTRETLALSFQAASSKRLLRLGSTLRVAVEEIGRYADGDPHFSRRRFSFFLSRAWALSQGMRHALVARDETQWDHLTWRPGGREVPSLDAVTLGVLKRVVPNAFVAFEFRMRVVTAKAGLDVGTPLIWSCIFPLSSKAQVPPEAYLHLPQKQKFKASELLPGRVIHLGPVRLAEDGRISLTDESKVEVERDAFTDWETFSPWSPESTLERVKAQETGPFDLEVELQEDVVLPEWEIGEETELERERQLVFPIRTPYGDFHAAVGMDEDAARLRTSLQTWKKKKKRPPLFGVLHFEMCRFMLQPLTVFVDDAPDSLMLSKDSFDAASLVRTLDFR